MKNKIGIILILLSLLICSLKRELDINNINYHNKMIAKIHDSYHEFSRYIYIPKYNIKRLIKNGTNSSILDKYYVGRMNLNYTNLEVLAGHNVNIVFRKIHYLKKNDIVYLEKEKYRVVNYKEIDINDYSILKNYEEKTLILITCTNDKNKRYIVMCKVV